MTDKGSGDRSGNGIENMTPEGYWHSVEPCEHGHQQWHGANFVLCGRCSPTQTESSTDFIFTNNGAAIRKDAIDLLEVGFTSDYGPASLRAILRNGSKVWLDVHVDSYEKRAEVVEQWVQENLT